MQINLVVTQESDRLDRWLSRQLTDLSRARLQKLITQGYVAIEGKVCREKKTILQPGEKIRLTIPAVESIDLKPESMPLDILYEDEAILIINKAANLVVHPAPGHPNGTLVNALLAHCPNLKGIGGVQRPGIVHRLDKDTTGAMVIAKTDVAYQHLQQQLQAKTARREYWGIVYGSPQQEKGTINQPIGRHPVERKKMSVVSSEKRGRIAVTHWQCLERLGNYSWLEFRLETGRTHQIRVHSQYMGYPIVGDPLYCAGRSVGVNLTGQALHARKLTLQHPITQKTIEAIAPLPPEFTKLLTVFRQRC